MVGRDRELARATGLLDDALAGRGRLVLCTGEAGIGKTRLAEGLAAAAHARGVPVAWARAADRGSSPPYGLWRLVLEEPAVNSGSGPGADLWSPAFGPAGGPDLGADSGVARRFALFAEVRRRLAAAAGRNGLVLVLDDLQWADEASAVLLADVVRQLRGTRILAFATSRDAPDGIVPRLSAEANTERVELRGLPAEAVADLLLAAGLQASPQQARRVHDETGGNPFLVRELAQTLIVPAGPAGLAGPVGPAVPGRVLEATGYRLTQLSDDARAVLQAAAVAGNSFSAGVVAKMLDRPVLSLLAPLDEARGAGFLVAGERPGDHRFSHALVSSAVVARLSAAEQRRLHTAAADAIESLYEGQLRLHLAEVARHRVEASLPGDRTRAVAACEAAASAADESLAFEEAVRLYRQALSAGEAELGEDDRSRLELGLAAALHRSGDLPGSQQTASRAGRRAEARRDRLGLARTALVMEATGVPEWDGEICRVCEQALAADDLPGGLRARVAARYAQALVYRGEYERAGPVSRDALAAAESAGDTVALVDALRARQLACCAPDGLAERTVLAERMLAAAGILGSAWAEMWGRLWRIDTLFETGQLRRIQRELTDLGSCLDRLSGPIGRWHYLLVAATLAMATGRFTEAARLAREAFKVFSDMGHPAAIGGLSVILSQSALHIGLEQSGLAWHVRPHPPAAAAGGRGHHPGGRHHLSRPHPGDDPPRPGRPGGSGSGLRTGGAGPVLDTNAGHAHGRLGSRPGHRRRPGPHGRYRVPGVAVRAVPWAARRERGRGRGLPGPGRAAARDRGRRAGAAGRGGGGPADGGVELRRQRRARVRGAGARRARRGPGAPPGGRGPVLGAGGAGPGGGRSRAARDGAVQRADRAAAIAAARSRLAAEPSRARGGPAGRAGTDQ